VAVFLSGKVKRGIITNSLLQAKLEVT